MVAIFLLCPPIARVTSQTLFISNSSSSEKVTVKTTEPALPVFLVALIPSSSIQKMLPAPSPETLTSQSRLGAMDNSTDSPAATVLLTTDSGNTGSAVSLPVGVSQDAKAAIPISNDATYFEKLNFIIYLIYFLFI